MLTDIQIAKETQPKPIQEITSDLGIHPDDVELYGRFKAKINVINSKNGWPSTKAKLILVTAINPTPAGEGKTTVSIGLADAMTSLNKKCILAIREPSLGPLFGMKGGATGGGHAQVIPMEDINLHFTGDMHAVTAANNLLAAMLDNHIKHGDELNIDPTNVIWRRCMDMNDRQLRSIVAGLGGLSHGVPREDGFDITAASEVMAVLCLSKNIEDLKSRLRKMVIALNREGNPITAGDIKAEGAMAVLLKDALKPNLVQTLEHTPVFIHGGPFANIAHGCNSLIATKLAMRLGDYVVTEAGFGADLGAEKFIDIKCRTGNIMPSAVVLVASVRALKLHGGLKKHQVSDENIKAVQAGLPNLLKHMENIRDVYHLPFVVAINHFSTDTQAEIDTIINACNEKGVAVTLCDVWEKGSEGGLELAQEVIKLCERTSAGTYVYANDLPLYQKIIAVAKKVYGAGDVDFAPGVMKELKHIEDMGYASLPVCISKTQYSLSDDARKLGRPEGFVLSVRNVRLSAGAGFVVAYTGDLIAMPGLPKVPSAEKIDIDETGTIVGFC